MMPELQLRAMVSIVAPEFNLRLKPPLKFFRASSSSTSIEYPPLHNHPQWSGLHHWRRSPMNNHRYWGPNGQFKNPIELKPTLILFLAFLLSIPARRWRKWVWSFFPLLIPLQKLSFLNWLIRNGEKRVFPLDFLMHPSRLLAQAYETTSCGFVSLLFFVSSKYFMF